MKQLIRTLGGGRGEREGGPRHPTVSVHSGRIFLAAQASWTWTLSPLPPFFNRPFQSDSAILWGHFLFCFYKVFIDLHLSLQPSTLRTPTPHLETQLLYCEEAQAAGRSHVCAFWSRASISLQACEWMRLQMIPALSFESSRPRTLWGRDKSCCALCQFLMHRVREGQ